MKEIFTKSESFKEEYSATIVRVGELKDIENSDNLKQAIIDGFSVVVNKNDVKEGDYMIYCKNETELNAQFLSVNNMYELGERERNANYADVQALIDEGKQDEAKTMVGYFNKNGRVKMIRLRGCPSMGVLMKLESMANWDKDLKGVNLGDYVKYDDNGNFIPFDFDTVNGKLFIKAYVPKLPNQNQRGDKSKKRNKRLNRFDRMISGEFSFHYDTSQLQSNMWRFNPTDLVDISVKLHGTSAIFGNILVKRTTLMNKLRDWINSIKDRKIAKIDRKIAQINKQIISAYETSETVVRVSDVENAHILEKKKTKIENSKIRNFDTKYDNVYSSRTVIKNQYINKQVGKGFYSTDVWGEYNQLLDGKIPRNITIYGEIVGYLSGCASMIQKGYDYGCEIGTNKLMIYRVTEKLEDGTHREYEIDEVVRFGNDLRLAYPSISDRIMPYPLLYHGKLSDLYPDIDTSNHWHENVLEAMKNDTEHFGMEKNEPLCKNKVPREGICIRIANDPVKECFKLKSITFLQKEAKSIDAGEVDIEMADSYL